MWGVQKTRDAAPAVAGPVGAGNAFGCAMSVLGVRVGTCDGAPAALRVSPAWRRHFRPWSTPRPSPDLRARAIPTEAPLPNPRHTTTRRAQQGQRQLRPSIPATTRHIHDCRSRPTGRDLPYLGGAQVGWERRRRRFLPTR